MSIMCSDVTSNGVVAFDLGIKPNGRAIFRISWWNGIQWSRVCYRSFDEARQTYDMIRRMG